MFVEIERYVSFIIDNKLTQRQFLFLYMAYTKRWDLMKRYLIHYPASEEEPGKFLSRVESEDLIERGFLIKVGEGIDMKNYTIGLAFKKIFVDGHVAVEELKNVYPAFVKHNGSHLVLQLMDEYELKDLYTNRIGYEQLEHEEVLKDIEYGNEHELIKGKIETFVRSKGWVPIRKLRLNIQKEDLNDDDDE